MAVVGVPSVVVLFLPDYSPWYLAFTVDGILPFVMPLPQAFCPLLFLLLGELHWGRGRGCPVTCISPTEFTPTVRFVILHTTWGHFLRGAWHWLLTVDIRTFSPPTLLLFSTLHFSRGGVLSFSVLWLSLDPYVFVAYFSLLLFCTLIIVVSFVRVCCVSHFFLLSLFLALTRNIVRLEYGVPHPRMF